MGTLLVLIVGGLLGSSWPGAWSSGVSAPYGSARMSSVGASTGTARIESSVGRHPGIPYTLTGSFGEILGGKTTWGRSCPKRVSVTNTNPVNACVTSMHH